MPDSHCKSAVQAVSSCGLCPDVWCLLQLVDLMTSRWCPHVTTSCTLPSFPVLQPELWNHAPSLIQSAPTYLTR